MAQYVVTRDGHLFEALVRRYERELYSYLCRYLGNAELADDVFQSTFLQVHLKCESYETGRKVRPWLYAIATNRAIDALRRKKRQKVGSLDRPRASSDSFETGTLADLLVSDEQDPQLGLLEKERNEMVRRALATLSEQMRHVVHLVYYQGLKYREAADVLSVPVGTVKSRMNAAISKLSDYWKQARPSQFVSDQNDPSEMSLRLP